MSRLKLIQHMTETFSSRTRCGAMNVVHSTKSRPAGKCFRHVLNKLQEAYGGELAESVLEKLCKKARAKYNLEKRTQKL